MPFLSNWLQINSQNVTTPISPTGGLATVRVNIIGPSETASWYSDVLTKIVTAMTGSYPTKTLQITQNNNTNYTGSDLTTTNFDCVFIWTDAGYNTTLGTNLNNYIANNGNLIICVFAIASVSITNFTYTNCPVLFPGNQNMSSTSLGTYTSSDPLMLGVTSFNPGSARFGANALTLQAGATAVANYNDGNILVAKKVIGSSRTVALNFFPVSSTARSDFWTASTDGSKLMANAIMWAGKGV